MNRNFLGYRLFLRGMLLSAIFLVIPAASTQGQTQEDTPAKLYWFIPDGMRADPDVFDIFQWAEQGELPNIRTMMDNGSYGYSIPTFPSHTPTNFATLFTGTYPTKHGVADGPMHTEGNPLSRVSVGGFSAAAKKVDPLWVTMERDSNSFVVLLSVPGSTPPELEQGMTIRGRWGGWGADFHATNFEEDQDGLTRRQQGRGARLFFFGPQLTKYRTADLAEPTAPALSAVTSYAPVKEVRLTQYGTSVDAYIYDSTDNQQLDYDRVAFSTDGITIAADLAQGSWSGWLPILLTWQAGTREVPIQTAFNIKVIKLEENGYYRIRFFYNNLNKHVTQPPAAAERIIKGVGPMVDFVDNFPPQLIYSEEDKETFLEEADMSLDWHRRAAAFLLKTYDPDVFIHDIYTPNQMLTSRWWMGYLDPKSRRYDDASGERRKQLWQEVKALYNRLDAVLGELLKSADENTYIILSSDHGAVPLDQWVRLNNFFAQRGWLKFTIDPKTGEPIIDWANSQVIYLKMAHVYINPQGLGGNWYRASGDDYEKLRNQVKMALFRLKDPQTGTRPLEAVYSWEEAPAQLHLPVDRIGDLVLVNRAGYGWNEEMTGDHRIFDLPLKTGYKQAILAEQEKGMWTPFIVMGPNVRKGYRLEAPIQHVDQYPTIMTLLGRKPNAHVQGKIIREILK